MDSVIKKALDAVASRGGWESVFCHYPRIMDAANGRQKPCPFSSVIDPKSTKFRLYKDWNQTGAGYHNDYGRIGGGIRMIQLAGNFDTPGKAAYHILQLLGGVPVSSTPLPVITTVPQLTEQEIAHRKAHIEKLLLRSNPANNNWLYRQYLASRGLPHVVTSTDLRIGRRVFYRNEDGEKSLLNALLGVMRNPNGDVVSIHRIYMDDNGNGIKGSDSKRIKMLMPPACQRGEVLGSAIRLAEPCVINGRKVLALTEGIETALAVTAAFHLPVWSCYSTELLKAVEIPHDVNAVHIFADNDFKNGAGLLAAEHAAQRLRERGVEVKIFLPQPPEKSDLNNGKGIDWLDLFNYDPLIMREQVRQQIVVGL